jgi:hypothetical protein
MVLSGSLARLTGLAEVSDWLVLFVMVFGGWTFFFVWLVTNKGRKMDKKRGKIEARKEASRG